MVFPFEEDPASLDIPQRKSKRKRRLEPDVLEVTGMMNPEVIMIDVTKNTNNEKQPMLVVVG